MRRIHRASIAVLFLALCSAAARARAGDQADPMASRVAKGLEFLVSQQQADGCWSASGDQFKVPITALSGLNLLMAGNTTSEGQYSAQLNKAIKWLVQHGQPSGLIVEPGGVDNMRSMYGHGFSVLFLASVLSGEKNADRRAELTEMLTRAVEFTGKAQTKAGGWGYVPANEENQFDEGSTTITQVQSLRAAKLAGIPVAEELLNKAAAYLQKSTTDKGGVVYSLQGGSKVERPALTIGALASLFGAKDYAAPLAARWLQYAQKNMPVDLVVRDNAGHWDYTQFYYGQVLYGLGDDGYARLFPDAAPQDQLTWSNYRKALRAASVAKQAADGSWQGSAIGPIFTTNCLLTVLQLDNDELPVFQRSSNEQAAAPAQGAAPPNADLRRLDELRTGEKESRYWIGIACRTVEIEEREKLKLADGQGLAISQVVPNSPAAKADLRQGDVIITAAGKPVGEVSQLVQAVANAGEGPLKLEIVRDGKSQAVEVTPARSEQGQVIIISEEGDEDEKGELREKRKGKRQERKMMPQAGGPWGNVYRPQPGQPGAPLANQPGSPLTYQLPFGGGVSNTFNAAGMETLPDDMEVTIQKKGKSPAIVTARLGAKLWRTTEMELDMLPPPARAYASRQLGKSTPANAWGLLRAPGGAAAVIPPAGGALGGFKAGQQQPKVEVLPGGGLKIELRETGEPPADRPAAQLQQNPAGAKADSRQDEAVRRLQHQIHELREAMEHHQRKLQELQSAEENR